jgi:hypothetical protein
MAGSNPAGDNARKGAVKKRTQDGGDGQAGLDQARQDIRRVHGGEKERREIQGRSAGKRLIGNRQRLKDVR